MSGSVKVWGRGGMRQERLDWGSEGESFCVSVSAFLPAISVRWAQRKRGRGEREGGERGGAGGEAGLGEKRGG